MSKTYILQKDYYSPYCAIYKGVFKTEDEWMRIFPNLKKGDCEMKTDWFLPKVEPKEYEILSFSYRYDEKNIILTKKDEEYFGIPEFYVLIDDLLKSCVFTIYSIKRLSDGEIFSVGDIVLHKTDSYTEKIQSIIKVDTKYDKYWFITQRFPNYVKDIANFTIYKVPYEKIKEQGHNCVKSYTKEEVLKIEKKAFNAAKQSYWDMGAGRSYDTYPTFQDYKNS